MVIYLVRHARPEGVEGMCYGRSDVRTNDEETGRVARSLRATLPAEVLEAAPIHSSPLTRCSTLARELAPARAALLSPELLELDFGSWEGSAWSEVPRRELDAWARDPWGYAPGGGESAKAALLRFEVWKRRVSEEGQAAVIAVTHAGLIRLALSAGSADPTGLSLAIPYGSVHPLVIESARNDPRDRPRRRLA
jgi:alpha-ribazole phosphatase